MADVTLWRDEAGERPVPDVCVRCGRPAAHVVDHTFYGPRTDAGTALAMLGAVGGLLGLLAVHESVRLAVPVCGRHRRFLRRGRILVVSGVLLPVLALAATLTGFGLADAQGGPVAADSPAQVLGIIGACSLVPALLWALVVVLTWRRWTIRAAQVTADRVVLAGVSDEYAVLASHQPPARNDDGRPARDPRPWMR